MGAANIRDREKLRRLIAGLPPTESHIENMVPVSTLRKLRDSLADGGGDTSLFSIVLDNLPEGEASVDFTGVMLPFQHATELGNTPDARLLRAVAHQACTGRTGAEQEELAEMKSIERGLERLKQPPQFMSLRENEHAAADAAVDRLFRKPKFRQTVTPIFTRK
jgi:hypothetical protein